MIDFLNGQDLNHWILAVGYVGLMMIVFLETGTFFGFFLPGDSLVFTAGLLASKGILHIWILVPLFVNTAFGGYVVGYWFGKRLGYWLMQRQDSFWFKKRFIVEANKFYRRHGGKALILGRLVPFARTFVPIVAGMGAMPYKRYLYCNIAGALVWGAGVTLIGYYLGGLIPNLSDYLVWAILLIIFVSLLPALVKLATKLAK